MRNVDEGQGSQEKKWVGGEGLFRPKTHLMGHLLYPVHAADDIEGFNVRREATVEAEDLGAWEKVALRHGLCCRFHDGAIASTHDPPGSPLGP
jgi:hypothetical protein